MTFKGLNTYVHFAGFDQVNNFTIFAKGGAIGSNTKANFYNSLPDDFI